MMIGQRAPNPFDMGMEPMRLDVPPVQLPQAAPAKQGTPWMAILADALSGLAGQQGQYPQRIARERAEQTDFERGEQQYQRRRADQISDQDASEQRAARKPYRWESNDGSLMEMGPDGMVRQVYKDPTPKPDWRLDPTQGWVDMNKLARPQPRRFDTLPEGAVPVGDGGPTSQASGGFRQYR